MSSPLFAEILVWILLFASIFWCVAFGVVLYRNPNREPGRREYVRVPNE